MRRSYRSNSKCLLELLLINSWVCRTLLVWTVSRMSNVFRAILFRWQQKYDQVGPVALETEKTPGPELRLSLTQLSKLYAIITGSGPAAAAV
jgi:hypothetical protein